MDDTTILAGSEAITDALVVYSSAQRRGKERSRSTISPAGSSAVQEPAAAKST